MKLNKIILILKKLLKNILKNIDDLAIKVLKAFLNQIIKISGNKIWDNYRAVIEGNNILEYNTESAAGIVMGTGNYGDQEITYDTQNSLLSGRRILTSKISSLAEMSSI